MEKNHIRVSPVKVRTATSINITSKYKTSTQQAYYGRRRISLTQTLLISSLIFSYFTLPVLLTSSPTGGVMRQRCGGRWEGTPLKLCNALRQVGTGLGCVICSYPSSSIHFTSHHTHRIVLVCLPPRLPT